MKSAIFVGALALGAISTSVQAERGGEFTFATATFGSIEATATTKWQSSDGGLPSVEETFCKGENEQIEFVIDSDGGLGLFVQFLYRPDARGNRDSADGDDLVWLHVDGRRYQVLGRSMRNDAFVNIEYPVSEPAEIILRAQYRMSVRDDAGQPFRPFSSLSESLVEARKLSFSMIEPGRHADADKAHARIGQASPIDNRGLRQAVTWCRSQVASTAARTLPDEVIQQFDLRAWRDEIRDAPKP